METNNIIPLRRDPGINEDIKALAPQMPSKYLRNFFAEKDIPEMTFKIAGRSGINVMPNTVVVEHIAQMGNSDEISRLEQVIRNIDLHNGDINHLFKHLAKAIAR